jgi:hypothetical protein
MYYIYHIPTFKRKNGKIGKIGCTEEPDNRVNRQGYTEYEILEEHTDIMSASEREIQLQKLYGYPVDCIPYYKSRSKWGSVAGKKGGEKGGKTNIESGHIQKLGNKYGKTIGKNNFKKHAKINGKIQGKIQGKKNIESGHMDRMLIMAVQKIKKPILQYTKDGQFIKEWECAKYAGVELKIQNSDITTCCRGKLKSAGGYVWKYKE